jgi:dihydrofolate reductase
MSKFVVYIAMSVDGYIADGNGDVHWLEAFDRDDYGYEEFINSIGSILIGRATYDQVMSFGPWPYRGIPTLVWSGGKVDGLPDGAVGWSENLEETASWLAEKAGEKDIWILGGAQTIQQFLAAGLVDQMDIFVMPVLLGGGIRLFDGENSEPQMLKLEQTQPYANGVVKLSYKSRR